MRAVNGPRPVWPLLVMAALLAATPALASCGAGGPSRSPYVAEFGLGADTPEAREFVLTPMPGPRVEVPSPAPDSGGQSALESAYQPSIAWVNDGQYLGVVTFGSSGCPTGPLGVEVVAEQEIEIRLGPLFPDRDACSADLSGHVTVVELPSGVTPAKPLVARFGDHEVTIEATGR
jgi:hypothetical protein